MFEKSDTDTHVCGIDNDDKEMRYGCFVVISTRRENEEEEKDLFHFSGQESENVLQDGEKN